jgi:hypothetical protein
MHGSLQGGGLPAQDRVLGGLQHVAAWLVMHGGNGVGAWQVTGFLEAGSCPPLSSGAAWRMWQQLRHAGCCQRGMPAGVHATGGGMHRRGPVRRAAAAAAAVHVATPPTVLQAEDSRGVGGRGTAHQQLCARHTVLCCPKESKVCFEGFKPSAGAALHISCRYGKYNAACGVVVGASKRNGMDGVSICYRIFICR